MNLQDVRKAWLDTPNNTPDTDAIDALFDAVLELQERAKGNARLLDSHDGRLDTHRHDITELFRRVAALEASKAGPEKPMLYEGPLEGLPDWCVFNNGTAAFVKTDRRNSYGDPFCLRLGRGEYAGTESQLPPNVPIREVPVPGDEHA